MENERIEKLKKVEELIPVDLDCCNYLRSKLPGLADISTDCERYIESFIELTKAISSAEFCYQYAMLSIQKMWLIYNLEG